MSLIFGMNMVAQRKLHKSEHVFVNIMVDPGATVKEESLNLVGEIGLISGIKQIKFSTQILDGLEGGYLDLCGGVGVSVPLDIFEKMRLSAGLRGGVIKRGFKSNKTYTYPLFGLEGMASYKITDKTGIILRLTYDRRSDGLYTGADTFYRESFFIGFNFEL